MAGVMNHTARQFNLKVITKDGYRASVRLAPGFNVVPNEHWKCFVDGKKIDTYLEQLKVKGFLEFGPHIDDLELDTDSTTVVKSKIEPIAKLKKEADKAEKEAEKLNLENEKLKAELDKAKAEAEKAMLELEALKKK